MADTDGGTIERSIAYNNGFLCGSSGGGPVGLWTWDSNNITIQNNESYANRSGAATADGGGLDLDGGVTNSKVQYNYTHGNDGAGVLVGSYTWAPMCEVSALTTRASSPAGLDESSSRSAGPIFSA